jgi:hypothetical protein
MSIEGPATGPRVWIARLVLLALMGGLAVYALDLGPFASLDLSVLNVGAKELREVDLRWRGGRIHMGRLAPGEAMAESIRAEGETGLDLSFKTSDGRAHEVPVDVALKPGSRGRVQIQVGDGPRVSWSEDLKGP